MKVAIDFDGYTPIRAHADDAGLDLRAKHGGVVPPHGSRTFGTGIHVHVPKGMVGLMLPKSGLMMKHDLLTFGVVDAGYSGEVMVHVFNLGNNNYKVKPGDKLTQLLLMPVCIEKVEVVDRIYGGERGDNGFGSSGR